MKRMRSISSSSILKEENENRFTFEIFEADKGVERSLHFIYTMNRIQVSLCRNKDYNYIYRMLFPYTTARLF